MSDNLNIIGGILWALIPSVIILIIVIIVIVVVVKVKKFTRSYLGVNLSKAAKLIGEGAKEEATRHKPITRMTEVYRPAVNRDFPEVGYTGMNALACNGITGILNAIEAGNPETLSRKTYAPSAINKVKNITDDLIGRNATMVYDNIKIHKSGISDYKNSGKGNVKADFEISMEYDYALRTEKNPKAATALKQAAYRVTLTYNQHGFEESADVAVSYNCPSCGAPIDLSDRGKVCKYCGSGFTEIADKIWQVSDFVEI